MDGKHTPLPWVVEQGECNPLIVAHTKDGPLTVAEVLDDVYPDTDGQQANARLIAAAPELLAALKALMDIQDCTDDCWCVEVGNPGTCEACRARAAIAKAEGRS